MCLKKKEKKKEALNCETLKTKYIVVLEVLETGKEKKYSSINVSNLPIYFLSQ